MGERKVINKYIPADFDPSLIPRGKKLKDKDGTVPVRMMLPFSIQCSTCYTFLYRGRKFNSRKEAMGGSNGTYLGITRWRFYIKCTGCARPITILTDPKNADYEMESGGTRNYEVYKDKAETEQATIDEQKEDELNDPMKALENRVLESQKEMIDMDQLEQIQMLNAKHVQLLKKPTDILHHNKKEAVDDLTRLQSNQNDDLLTEEDEELIRSIRFGNNGSKETNSSSSINGQMVSSTSQTFIHRLDDDENDHHSKRRMEQQEHQQEKRKQSVTAELNNSGSYDNIKTNVVRLRPTIKAIKKRRKEDEIDEKITTPPATTCLDTAHITTTNENGEKKSKLIQESTNTIDPISNNTNDNEPSPKEQQQGLSGLLGCYGSDSDES